MHSRKRSTPFPHPFRPTSIMQFEGVAFGNMGYSEEAAKYLKRSIADLYILKQDANRLAILRQDSGILLKKTAHLKEAASIHHRSLSISRRLSKHLRNYCPLWTILQLLMNWKAGLGARLLCTKNAFASPSSTKHTPHRRERLPIFVSSYAYQSRFQLALISIRKAVTIKEIARSYGQSCSHIRISGPDSFFSGPSYKRDIAF